MWLSTQRENTDSSEGKALFYKLMDHSSPKLLGQDQASGFLQRPGGVCAVAAVDDAIPQHGNCSKKLCQCLNPPFDVLLLSKSEGRLVQKVAEMNKCNQ